MGDEHHAHGEGGSERNRGHGRGHPSGNTETEHALPGGLTVAANGLRLDPSDSRIEPGVRQEWTFRVRNDAGDVVTDFEAAHDQLAHLILVRRDLTRFQHLHPTIDEAGTWSSEFTLPDPGVYRAFVDVVVEGQPTTLGLDLFASGAADYDVSPGSTREATTDGYDVFLSPRDIPATEDITLEFKVRRDGDPVHLDPYLGALGHLVVLREADLAYLHVHPETTAPAEGIARFAAQFPTPGRYRLFLQAKPDGNLVTATFDVDTTRA